jgi:hypothetical protein
MNNIAPYPNIWEGMTLDQINDFKDKCQRDMPTVELMKIKAPPNSFAGRERDQKLMIMGYSEEEIEELTGFKDDAYPIQSTEQTSEANQIRFYGKEIWGKMKAYDLMEDREFEAEDDQRLKHGIELGLIEEEVEPEPKL